MRGASGGLTAERCDHGVDGAAGHEAMAVTVRLPRPRAAPSWWSPAPGVPAVPALVPPGRRDAAPG